MPSATLNYVELPVANAEAAAAFYEAALGWSLTRFAPTYAGTIGAHSDLGLDADTGLIAPLPNIETDDLETMQAQVEAAGGRIVAPIFAFPGGRRFHFATEESAEAFAAAPGDLVPAVDEELIATQSEGYPMDTCPVTGEPLGSMGEPVDVLLGHRLVKLCCGGCEGQAADDPGAAIEKLDAAATAEQGRGYAAETCPVAGMKLGSMGEPVDFVFAGELVRFCCGGCPPKFLANPAKYLEKLGAAAS